MAERKQNNRWRCTVTGCNPVLVGEQVADAHVIATGHRIAKWPVRSTEGRQKARERNKSGYYDKYNVNKPNPFSGAYSGSGYDYRSSDFDDDDQSWDAHKNY